MPIPGLTEKRALFAHQGGAASSLGLAGYLRLRWVALGAYAIGCWMAVLALGFEIYVLPLSAGLLALGFSQQLAQGIKAFMFRHPEPSILTLLVLDILGFTYVLYWTGGAHNPFAALYLLHVVVACIMLRATIAAFMLFLCVCSYAYLLVLVQPIQAHEPPAYHYSGMVLAMALTGAGIAYFIMKLNRDLNAHEKALDEARNLVERTRRQASVSTLAAGVAHALATPIGTMSLIGEDLENHLSAANLDPEAMEDLRQLRWEIRRCRDLLRKLGPPDLQDVGEEYREVALAEVLALCLRQLPQRQAPFVQIDSHSRDAILLVPVESLVQAIVTLLTNALQASSSPQTVKLQVEVAHGDVEWRIEDRGEGMAPEVLEKVGEPFFSTRADGHHLGLGVFLVRSLAEQLGGDLRIESRQGGGTHAVLTFPMMPELRKHALGENSREALR